MPIINLIVAIAAVGILLYCINRFVPMDAKIKSILNIVVIIALVVFLLDAFGVIDALRGVKTPRMHG